MAAVAPSLASSLPHSAASLAYLSKLKKPVAQSSGSTTRQTAFATYRLDLAAQAIYEFIWNEYCDWYVELTKPVLNDENVSEERKAEVRRVLLAVMEASLRLAHPLMPYLTEEIWQTLAPKLGIAGETIMLAQYPTADEALINDQAEADMQWLQGLIGAVRNIRGEMGLGNARLLPVLLQNTTDAEKAQIARIEPLPS